MNVVHKHRRGAFRAAAGDHRHVRIVRCEQRLPARRALCLRSAICPANAADEDGKRNEEQQGVPESESFVSTGRHAGTVHALPTDHHTGEQHQQRGAAQPDRPIHSPAIGRQPSAELGPRRE
jgi:hypothetical protein